MIPAASAATRIETPGATHSGQAALTGAPAPSREQQSNRSSEGARSITTRAGMIGRRLSSPPPNSPLPALPAGVQARPSSCSPNSGVAAASAAATATPPARPAKPAMLTTGAFAKKQAELQANLRRQLQNGAVTATTSHTSPSFTPSTAQLQVRIATSADAKE